MYSDDWVYFQIEPSNMTYVTRIMEGFEYVGVVTALDGKKGTGYVRTTADTAPMATDILLQLPFPTKVLTKEDALKRGGKA